MQFDFFTFGGRFFWEDVYNYQNWVIQRNTRTKKYRLLDSHDIRRHSGRFEDCKNTLLKYIEACELDEPYDDTIILLHGYGHTKKSMKHIAKSLKTIKANIIIINYASLHKSLNYQSNLLAQFFKNMEIKGKLHFITSGAGGLILRKLLGTSRNYRKYKVAGVLEINPINSGSDLAELFLRNRFFRKILGPMLPDLTTRQTLLLPKLPKDIPHALIFCPSLLQQKIFKALEPFESFPPISPPSEQSYAPVFKYLPTSAFSPLTDSQLCRLCRHYILHGNLETEKPNASENTEKRK